jgi:hypothetical protein
MTNQAATDGDRGPPRPTRSSLCGHKPQKGKRMEIHPAGDPSAAGRGAAPAPPRATANPPPKSGGRGAPGGGATYPPHLDV